MLQPENRLTFIDAMRPPVAFRLESAMAVTFTLDLRALLAAPAAMALTESASVEADGGSYEPIELLHALRSHANKITVFSHVGEIALPASRRVFAFLERAVVPVDAPRGGVVHPKVWVLRYEAVGEPTDSRPREQRLRVLIASRNLTFDASWDTVVRLDEATDAAGALLGPVGELFEGLLGAAVATVSTDHRDRVRSLSAVLGITQFALPVGVDDLRTHVLGLSRTASPLPAAAERSLIISPFVSDDFFTRVRPAPVDELVSRPESLDRLGPAALDKVAETYAFDDGSAPGEAASGRRAAAMTAFLLTWPSPSLAEFGDPRPLARRERRRASEVLDVVAAEVANAIEPLVRLAPIVGVVDQRWYWAAPLFLDRQLHPSAPALLLARDGASLWEGDQAGRGLRAHLAEARTMAEHGPVALGRAPDDLVEVLAELAVGGPAQCALRMISSVSGLPISHDRVVENAAWIGAAFRSFFNAPEVTAVIVDADSEESDADERAGRYWRDVLRHSIDGNLQAVLDEHAHVLRDWLGHLNFVDESRRMAAAEDITLSVAEALELRTSSFRVDIPGRRRNGDGIEFHEHRMRTRFAVAFGNQTLDDGGEVRVESVSRAFNSPFWPFVLISTSIGQEGLDFHLWCHAVVHWNLPSNPVDLEQREGRVHRYKGHAVRRNIAAIVGPELRAEALSGGVDPWSELFAMAVAKTPEADGEMVPYWVFHQGPAKIERHVPVMPFSRDAAALPRLRKTLAAYRLAFGQPRQQELVEFLGADRSDADLLLLASKLRIDLSPP